MIKLKDFYSKNYILVKKEEILFVCAYKEKPVHSIVHLKSGHEFLVEESVSKIESALR